MRIIGSPWGKEYRTVSTYSVNIFRQLQATGSASNAFGLVENLYMLSDATQNKGLSREAAKAADHWRDRHLPPAITSPSALTVSPDARFLTLKRMFSLTQTKPPSYFSITWGRQHFDHLDLSALPHPSQTGPSLAMNLALDPFRIKRFEYRVEFTLGSGISYIVATNKNPLHRSQFNLFGNLETYGDALLNQDSFEPASSIYTGATTVFRRRIPNFPVRNFKATTG